MNMYFVMGFVEVPQFGFMVRKEFSGFVREEPTEVIADDCLSYLIGDVAVPTTQVTKISKVTITGVDELDLTAIIGPGTHKKLKKLSKTPVTDDFDAWLKEFIPRVEADFDDANKAGELHALITDEVLRVMNDRMEFYRASIRMSEIGKDKYLARVTYRYAVEMAQHLHIMTLTKATKNMSAKDILNLMENFSTMR